MHVLPTYSANKHCNLYDDVQVPGHGDDVLDADVSFLLRFRHLERKRIRVCAALFLLK